MGNNREAPRSSCWDYDSSGNMRQARLRVELFNEGWWEYMDFNSGAKILIDSPLPDWMHESIALLNIAGIQVEVPDVGMRWEDNVYYLTIKGEF